MAKYCVVCVGADGSSMPNFQHIYFFGKHNAGLYGFTCQTSINLMSSQTLIAVNLAKFNRASPKTSCAVIVELSQ